jgi:hypothetical protein
VNSVSVKDDAYISSRDGEERGQESSKEIHKLVYGLTIQRRAAVEYLTEQLSVG